MMINSGVVLVTGIATGVDVGGVLERGGGDDL